jgi:hypothetical protein
MLYAWHLAAQSAAKLQKGVVALRSSLIKSTSGAD